MSTFVFTPAEHQRSAEQIRSWDDDFNDKWHDKSEVPDERFKNLLRISLVGWLAIAVGSSTDLADHFRIRSGAVDGKSNMLGCNRTILKLNDFTNCTK